MIRFIHTADVHYGMENYGRIDPATGIHSRLLDFDRSFNTCIDYAIANNVDFFLFSGDAYKTTNPSPTQQKLFLKSLFRLHEHNIPIVLIIGNHDNPLCFGKAHALELFNQLPLKGFHVISKPEIITLATKNGVINIVGIPWPTRTTVALSAKHEQKSNWQITHYLSESVAAIITDMAQKLDPNIPAVLAGHLTVSSGIFSGSEKRAIYGTDPIFLPSQLALPIFDYVALGHLHRYQNLNPGGQPAIVYSGSIDRIDFGERKEQKGFCEVSIEKKGSTQHTFIELQTRPFIQIEATIGTENQTEQLLAEIGKYAIKDAVIKIIYHVPSDAKDSVNIGAIQKACAAAWYIVGIIPIRKPTSRERRAHLKIDMDFASLLNVYFQNKIELKDKKERLIEKILFLQQEALLQEEQEEI